MDEVKSVLSSEHKSADTAYVVEDYPYGFKLRCRLRLWVETNKKGQRVCTQTSNPKAANAAWNKPKCGVYHDFAIIFLDEVGYYHVDAAQSYWSLDRLDEFTFKYYKFLDEPQRTQLEHMIAAAQ